LTAVKIARVVNNHGIGFTEVGGGGGRNEISPIPFCVFTATVELTPFIDMAVEA